MKFIGFISLLILIIQVEAYGDFKDASNGEFITISGKVSDVKKDSFKVKVKDNLIFVEMDDYGWEADGYQLFNGDEVVVNGIIDHDFLERKKIEAGSVYVKNINTYFFSNNEDEEGPFDYSYEYHSGLKFLPESAHATLTGKVKSISGRELIIDTGLRDVTVDTSEMIYNPLDNVGHVKVEKGDFVRISGFVDSDFFGKKELNATFIMTL